MSDFSRTDLSNYKSKRFPHIEVWERPVWKGSDLDFAMKAIPGLYKRALQERKKVINVHMRGIYGRSIVYKEHETAAMIVSIKDLVASTGCETREVAEVIRGCLGDVCFFRDQGERRIPVELGRIRDAFFSVKAGKKRQEIEEILFREDEDQGSTLG